MKELPSHGKGLFPEALDNSVDFCCFPQKALYLGPGILVDRVAAEHTGSPGFHPHREKIHTSQVCDAPQEVEARISEVQAHTRPRREFKTLSFLVCFVF